MTEQAVNKVIKLFLTEYNKYNNTDKHWTENLNNYIDNEWSKLDDSVAYLEHNFSDEDAEIIVEEVFQRILNELNISLPEYEEYDCDVNWHRLDELIDYYLTQIE